MGAVYLAEEEALGRKVALKLIGEKFASTGNARTRFVREARSMATVEHPNIVRLYAFGESEGRAYLVMEYVDGESLADRLAREKSLGPAEAIRLTRQIAEALDAAWEKRIVHRDIKPSNILIDRRGQARVADFGLAKPVGIIDESALTNSSAIVGTPYYISPEQIHGKELTCQSDIYSLGVMLYEMLTGEKPFAATSPLAVLDQHLHTPFPTLAGRGLDCPDALAQLVRVMTRKDPADRPGSYTDVVAALNAVASDRPLPQSLARTLDPPPEATRSFGSPLRKWALLAMAVIATLVATASFWGRYAPASAGVNPASASIPDGRLSVAVAPFYGPDDDSAKEGRVMAALVEKSIRGRFGKDEATVFGIEDTQRPVHDHDAARALGKKLGANAVIWGEAIALRGETNIQPYFTIIPPEPPPPKPGESAPSKGATFGDPLLALREEAPSLVVQGAAPNQFELRRTSASGVGDMVMLLAGVHALYRQGNAEKALKYLQAAPETPETLRHRAFAFVRLGRIPESVAAMREAEKGAPDPRDAQGYADLGDALLEADQTAPAVEAYRRAFQSAGDITTHFGTLFEGKLYTKEPYKYRIKPGQKSRETTTYLLGLDPSTGNVLERHFLPGVAQELSIRNGTLEISYSSDPSRADLSTLWKIGLARGRLDKPVYPTTNLLLRVHAMKNPRRIASNFLADFETPQTPDAPPPRFGLHLDKPGDVFADAPRSLPELESALRFAISRDPTQPWYQLFLGQALASEGKRSDATAAWSRVFEGSYPAIPYYDYSWMATIFERIGERNWADRAYSEALRRRKLIPQPIEDGFLIERLLNIPFMRTAAMASARGRDLPRQYLWVQRTREISGVCNEGEAGSPAAWEKYFRQTGDLELARREAAYRDALSRAPINLDAASTESDIALYVSFAAFVALWWVVGRTLIVRGIRRVPGSGSRLGAGVAITVLLGASLAVGLAGLLLNRIGLLSHPYWTAVEGLAAVVLLVGASSALWNRGIRAAVASLSLAERLAITAAALLLAGAAGGFAGAIERYTSLSRIPIGAMDGLGNPHFADILESSKGHVGDSPEMRYCLAVASHMAGDQNRARELYSSIPDDPRARDNLAALEKGAILPVHSLRDAEIANAFTAGIWSRAMRRFFFWRPIQPSSDSIEWIDISVFLALRWTMVGAVLLLGLTLAVKRSGNPAALSLSALARSFAIPFLLSFALPPMLFLVWLLPSPVMGPYTGSWYINLNSHRANPYPNPVTVKTEAADLAYNYWTDFWAMPHARPFWGAVAVSLVLGLILAVVSWKQSRSRSRGTP